MKRKAADSLYCERKRQEILSMIKSNLESIERFNSEHCGPNFSLKLTPNLSGLYGISLLHASVEVMAGDQLIQKMVSMGANPWGTREYSPLDLARNQYNRCLTKQQNADSANRLAFANKTDEAKRVLDVLEAVKYTNKY